MGEDGLIPPAVLEVRVGGWLHWRRGSDGEPIVVGAEIIPDPE